ncbi:MAG: hypothetical protein HY579_11430 [Nitrospinae bacterium]|nr:hypothetical protein [Nitrospinota bacterium]
MNLYLVNGTILEAGSVAEAARKEDATIPASVTLDSTGSTPMANGSHQGQSGPGPLPPGACPAVRPENGFAVKSWLWSAEDQDYTVEDLGKTGQTFFDKFANANDFFERVRHEDLFGPDQEGKIELVQYKYGMGRVVKSRILFPRARH